MTLEASPLDAIKRIIEGHGLGRGEAHRVAADIVREGVAPAEPVTRDAIALDERTRDEVVEDRIGARVRREARRVVDRWRTAWSNRLDGPLDWTLMTDVVATEPGRHPDDDPFERLEGLLQLPPFRASAAALRGLRAACLDSAADPWLCWRVPDRPERLRVFRAGPHARYRRRLRAIFREGLWLYLRGAVGDSGDPGPSPESASTDDPTEDLRDALEPLLAAWSAGDLEDDRWGVVLDAVRELEGLARHEDAHLAAATLQRGLYQRLRRSWLLDGENWWEQLRAAVDRDVVEVEREGTWTLTVAAEDAVRAEFAADALAGILDGDAPPIPPPALSRLLPGADGPVGFHLAVNDPWVTRGALDRAAADSLSAAREQTAVRNMSERDRAFFEMVADEEDRRGLDPDDKRPWGFWTEFEERWNDAHSEWATSSNTLRAIYHRHRGG